MFILLTYVVPYNYSCAFRYLTNEGIEYLRSYLHLPPEIVPSTLKRQIRPDTTRARPAATRSEASKPSEDRAGYRRTPGGPPGSDKKADVGAGATDLEFVSILVFACLYCQLTFIFLCSSERWIWKRKECTFIIVL